MCVCVFRNYYHDICRWFGLFFLISMHDACMLYVYVKRERERNRHKESDAVTE